MDNPWYATTTVVSRADVDAWLTQQRGDGDGDIVLFASHITWNGLIAAGLIDEIHLVSAPPRWAMGLRSSPARPNSPSSKRGRCQIRATYSSATRRRPRDSSRSATSVSWLAFRQGVDACGIRSQPTLTTLSHR